MGSTFASSLAGSRSSSKRSPTPHRRTRTAPREVYRNAVIDGNVDGPADGKRHRVMAWGPVTGFDASNRLFVFRVNDSSTSERHRDFEQMFMAGHVTYIDPAKWAAAIKSAADDHGRAVAGLLATLEVGVFTAGRWMALKLADFAALAVIGLATAFVVAQVQGMSIDKAIELVRSVVQF